MYVIFKPMISICITAWKEPKTIAKCIETFIDGIDGLVDYEVLLAAPDEETKNAAQIKIDELSIQNKFVYIKDPHKGKPFAINLLIDKARGDIIFFGDGDTYFAENVIPKMLKHFENSEVFAVTGRPQSIDDRDTMMGFFGHLLSDAAHHKRTVDLTETPTGKSLQFVKKRKFFPVSGYLFAMRKSDIRTPEDCLVEDAYFSYAIENRGGRIEYEPEAIVYVKYPKTLKDYFKQKRRSAGGYVQLWKYGIVKPETKSRSIWRELEYFWFPIKYAKSFREYIWAFMLYPIRLWMWIRIYWEQKIKKSDLMSSKGWERIESTK